MADLSWSESFARFLNENHLFVAPFVAALLTPIGIKVWNAIERHDERKRLRYEAKRAARLERKAARKAAKEAAKAPYYTSATVVPPPRLGHDGSGSERDAGG